MGLVLRPPTATSAHRTRPNNRRHRETEHGLKRLISYVSCQRLLCRLPNLSRFEAEERILRVLTCNRHVHQVLSAALRVGFRLQAVKQDAAPPRGYASKCYVQHSTLTQQKESNIAAANWGHELCASLSGSVMASTLVQTWESKQAAHRP